MPEFDCNVQNCLVKFGRKAVFSNFFIRVAFSIQIVMNSVNVKNIHSDLYKRLIFMSLTKK